MDFEWDEEKRRTVFAERRVDILHAALIFEGPVLTRRDDRRDYGEERMMSVGLVDGECFVVVHVERDGRTRLITAWKGGRNDRKAYEAGLARRSPPDEGRG